MLKCQPNRRIELNLLISAPLLLASLRFDPAIYSTITIQELLEDLPEVVSVQKNYLLENRKIPNDRYFEDQWHYLRLLGNSTDRDLDLDLAWDKTTGGETSDGKEIVVCVIDDGIDPSHEDLKENTWVNRQEIPSNGIDDDNNGYIDDYYGWNAIYENDNVFEDGSHGTPILGIIGATGNNEIGVAGINWRVKLMVVDRGASIANAMVGLSYAYQQRKLYNETAGEKGAFVVATSGSFGISNKQESDAPLWCLFYDKLGEVGILNCVATSNKGIDVDLVGDLPTVCSSDYLICSTAVNKQDEKIFQSGFGNKSIDLAAFGEEVFTTRINNSYDYFAGTSATSPQVAGTVALLYALDCQEFLDLSKTNPELAALRIKSTILAGVQYNTSLFGITVSHGRLNINGAVDTHLENCNQLKTEDLTFQISPNPFNNWIRIQSSEDIENIALYSNQGTLIFQKKMVGKTVEWLQLESDLPVGIYFIRINDRFKKLIKQ